MQIAGILDVTYYIQKDLLFFRNRKFWSFIIMVMVMQACQRTREPSFDLVAYFNGRRSQSFRWDGISMTLSVFFQHCLIITKVELLNKKIAAA